MASLEALGSTLTSIIGSFVASSIGTEALYQISNQTELWIAVLLVVAIYLVVATQILAQLTTPRDPREEVELEHVILLKLMSFLLMTCVMIQIRLVMDVFRYGLAVTPMAWDDYINFFNFTIFVVFVTVQMAQYLFRTRHSRADR